MSLTLNHKHNNHCGELRYKLVQTEHSSLIPVAVINTVTTKQLREQVFIYTTEVTTHHQGKTVQ